ncbi:hypothetical protein SE27_05595 [Acinetobacter harbinensis]|uniref:hypothetical protein n=1 Tax=Acinetobacter harbinensis TaxID=1353941 RepID=UPI00057CE134|nr:hypothetical protein [Acinetobacter harbinensis]KWQ04772.1 hypothetical protein SE27_05595 [Acinetobacter harbinensis]
MLKVGLMVLVVVCGLLLLALMLQSFKFLRSIQKQEAAEKKHNPVPVQRQLHPKLQPKAKDKP